MAFSHFPYWNPELGCGSVAFHGLRLPSSPGDLSGPRVLPRKHGAVGVRLVWALLRLETGQPARSTLCTLLP